MGMHEYAVKLEQAQQYTSASSIVELLAIIRKEKLRVSRVVVRYGGIAIDKYRRSIGADDLWTIYEQVFIAALDVHDAPLAEKCLVALKGQFPNSSRVSRLEGMQYEQRGEYAKAEAIYDEILKANAANALAMKRKIATLKAQKKTQSMIGALNEFLHSFGSDPTAWMELAEAYISIGAYRFGAFCVEELVLLNPMDSFLHNRLADLYVTIGGMENLRVARKHYCRSIELNKDMNIRAYAGLLVCTRTIASLRRQNDAEETDLNDRVGAFALQYLNHHYASRASSEIADISLQAFKSI